MSDQEPRAVYHGEKPPPPDMPKRSVKFSRCSRQEGAIRTLSIDLYSARHPLTPPTARRRQVEPARSGAAGSYTLQDDQTLLSRPVSSGCSPQTAIVPLAYMLPNALEVPGANPAEWRK
ncbi:hypothetical protein PLICRDRAFT_47014 [Plicaturopsis crispa FD-325 SS-3]|uniref:Uncharacterized protein n=1 Tax=Plicaturopsis crispa FD-325 SS-3 TaxID=944288 RepID=A0A0C9T6U2_PLICR|nr:hypothetical protein PLICRDRAFT_47014 [Plicaturopsis crispa FD-325 SS-3]